MKAGIIYHCDHCGHRVESSEVVFCDDVDLCDDCYEAHYE